MNDPYTSYETSLRLKKAGAPQDPEPHTFQDGKILVFGWAPRDDCPLIVRAFRADEIIEALGHHFDYLMRARNASFVCSISGVGDVGYRAGSGLHMTAVEALAAAWIAVLEAK